MTSRFQVQVTGRLPQGLTQAISTRFGEVVIFARPGSTVLNGSVTDQAALRSLLGLIWDTGSSVLAVTVGVGAELGLGVSTTPPGAPRLPEDVDVGPRHAAKVPIPDQFTQGKSESG